MKTILAFLQSPSEKIFPEGTSPRIINMYKDDQEYHRKMLRQSMTGNRLYQSFGGTFNDIIWDNVAPIDEVDMRHVEMSIVKHKPYLILTFGTQAEEALDGAIGAMNIKRMCCHHPNARGRTQSDLDYFATKVIEFMRNWNHESKIH